MKRLSWSDFAEFNGLLASAVEAGGALEAAVDVVGRGAREAGVRGAMGSISTALRDGASLADAIGGSAEIFPPEYPGLVRAAGKGGSLAEILHHAQSYGTLRARFEQRLRRLGVYLAGCGVTLAALLVVLVVVGQIVGTAYDDLVEAHAWWYSTASERSTGLLPYVRNPGWILFLLVVLVGVVLLSYRLLRNWALEGELGYRLPLVGRLQKSRDLGVFCEVVSLRLAGRSTLAQAVGAAADSLGNSHARGEAHLLRTRVKDGEDLSSALYDIFFFPRALALGVSLSAASGEVPQVFARFARIYRADVERSYDMLYQVLTPLGVLLLGNFALVAVVGFFAPMAELMREMMFF